MKPSELVKAALKGTNSASEYALYKATGISQATLSQYLKDRTWPGNNTARILAEAAGLDPLIVIGELEMERATDEATKSAWGKALASMRGSASALLLAVLAGLTACLALVLRQPFGLADVYQWVMDSALSIMFIM